MTRPTRGPGRAILGPARQAYRGRGRFSPRRRSGGQAGLPCSHSTAPRGRSSRRRHSPTAIPGGLDVHRDPKTMTGCWWLILASRCCVPGTGKSGLPGRRPTLLVLLINIRSRHPKFGRSMNVDLPRSTFAVHPMHRISITFYVQSAFASASLIFRAFTNRHIAIFG